MKRLYYITLLFMLTALLFGCTNTPSEKPADTTGKSPDTMEGTETSDAKTADDEPLILETIRLATTTSLDNSGLLKHILPDFTRETGIAIDVIAVGTGKALQHGRDGDVDVVLVHAPQSELQYIKDDWALTRMYICQNEFVIIGPESDPAGLKAAKTVGDAMKKLSKGKSDFISRGDNSGTHKREKSVWEAAGVEPSGDWYKAAGQGMGAVLTMANEQQAYTLTDTGTYYSMIDKLNLPILFSGDAILENVYSVLILNPEIHPHLKQVEIKEFAWWITSDETQEKIGKFKVNGHTLFTVLDNPDYIENLEFAEDTSAS